MGGGGGEAPKPAWALSLPLCPAHRGPLDGGLWAPQEHQKEPPRSPGLPLGEPESCPTGARPTAGILLLPLPQPACPLVFSLLFYGDTGLFLTCLCIVSCSTLWEVFAGPDKCGKQIGSRKEGPSRLISCLTHESDGCPLAGLSRRDGPVSPPPPKPSPSAPTTQR